LRHASCTSSEKQLEFGVRNLFVLTTWFVEHMKLGPLSRYMSLALVLAYALETTKYRLDDSRSCGVDTVAV